MIKKIVTCFLVLAGFSFNANAQSDKEKWVDSVFNQLTETERIGQLFMMPVPSHLENNKVDNVEKDIRFDNIGGILFTSGDPSKQIGLTNQFQSISKVPLLIGLDASNGLGVMLDSTLQFPKPLALGAIESDSLIFAMSKEIARQLKLLGVHINFSPVANLTDRNAEGYQTETYGEDKKTVSQKLLAYHAGLRSEGILACAKHFPIQGITISTVQKGIPVTIPFVDTVQAYPFYQLFGDGIAAVMPAASELPVFYEKKKAARKNKLSSVMLSSFFTGDWMRRNMQFNGLVVVDIRLLKSGVAKIRSADAELFAFQAGNDVMITEENPGPSIRKIRKLIKNQPQYRDQLNESVRKILAVKYDAGLKKRTPTGSENIMLKLNTPESKVLQQKLFRAAVTVVRNSNNTIPLKALENKRFATITIGDSTGTGVFNRMINRYVNTKHFFVDSHEDSLRVKNILEQYDVVIVTMTARTIREQLDGIIPSLRIYKEEQKIIIADFACTAFPANANRFETVISTFSDQSEMFAVVPQIIFGGTFAEGILPITMGTALAGTSVKTKSLRRFQYSSPEDVGMSARTLEKIDAIAEEAILSASTPGCHVLVARDGKIIYEKSYGHLTYEKQTRVTDSTIYDLASVTKVSSTLQAIMFLYDRGMLDLNKKASVYLPELKNSNKKDFTVKDILTHQAGLWPFIPFYAYTMKDTAYLPGYYSRTPSIEFPYMVADRLYAHSAMKDTLWNWSIKGKIREKPARTPFDYKYSDIGFYIMQHIAEKLLNQPIEDFVSQNLYEPLGAYTTGYLPLLKFPVNRIAPTENDKAFRKALLIGTVHDPGAAMQGGIAGHAGLFSTANDLAKLGQMMLQEGYYGGYQYYKPETVRLFSQQPYATNHRGLGWAKSIQSEWNSPTSLFASPKTFGHTGYTGTCIWVDPEFNLLYIFLSNRVHPEVNTKLLTTNIRTRIQDVIYQSIFDYCGTPGQGVSPEINFNSSAR
jgi:CubicO group peptidase (beta-lactamase class C family)/beta-glucosidase-like glycosyl hydrolase